MMYAVRDPKVFEAMPDSLVMRSDVMQRVRVDARDPVDTAAQVEADRHVYLQGMYDDADGVEFVNDGERMAYWTGWANAFASACEARPMAVWVEHPYSIGRRRHDPDWLEVFWRLLEVLESGLQCECFQFGVPLISPNVYQVPLGEGLIRREVGEVGGLWVNLPGQHAFGDRFTTAAEFAIGISWAKAHLVPFVCLWSNPSVSVQPARLEEAWRIIDLLDPAPVVTPPEDRPDYLWREGDTWETYFGRLAKRGREG